MHLLREDTTISWKLVILIKKDTFIFDIHIFIFFITS